MWNEDFEAITVEDETEEAKLEDENREEEDKPLVEDNEDDPVREEKQEDENAEEFPVRKGDDDSEENSNGIDVEVRLDHVAMELEENKTGEAIKNEEEFAFWEEDSEDKEEWKVPEKESTIGKGESPNNNEERKGETGEDVRKEGKHLTREEKNPEDDVEDKEKFSNGQEESIEERCSIGGGRQFQSS